MNKRCLLILAVSILCRMKRLGGLLNRRPHCLHRQQPILGLFVMFYPRSIRLIIHGCSHAVDHVRMQSLRTGHDDR